MKIDGSCCSGGASLAFGRRWKLQTKMTIWFSTINFLTISCIGILFIYWTEGKIEEHTGQNALFIAESLSEHPTIQEAFNDPEPWKKIQPFTEKLRIRSKVSFIVIGNKEGVRYSHPDKEKIGQKMIGGDNDPALKGKSYISIAEGSLGLSLRGKAPIKDPSGKIIGVVSVGYLYSEMDQILWSYIWLIAFILIVIFVLGFLGAVQLAKHVKKLIYGLEPFQISALYKQREAIIETVREGTMMVNNEGIVQMVNQKAVNMLELSSKLDVEGKPIANLIPESRMLEVLQSGMSELDREIEINGKQLIVNRLPIIDHHKIIGVVSSFRLKSEMDELNKELSQVHQYMEAMRAQTHEYQNTLYTISGLIQLESYEEAVAMIQEESQVHQNQISWLMKKVKDKWLSAILVGYYNRAKEMKVKLYIDPDTYIPEHMNIPNKTSFVSLLGNLIMNAMEELQKIKEERKVRIYMEYIEDTLILEVEDNGPGISDEVYPYIFEKGFSTKQDTSDEMRGFGLWKVKQVVEEFGGTFIVESGDWDGALFAITLPLKEVGRLD